MAMKMKTRGVSIDDKTYRAAKKLAKEKGCSISYLMRSALQEALLYAAANDGQQAVAK